MLNRRYILLPTVQDNFMCSEPGESQQAAALRIMCLTLQSAVDYIAFKAPFPTLESWFNLTLALPVQFNKCGKQKKTHSKK